MDSRESGNDDIRLADDIHGVAKLKWYYITVVNSLKSMEEAMDILLDDWRDRYP